MENLRWIILSFGLLVVLIIYLIGRKNDKSKQLDLPEPLSADAMLSIKTSDDDYDAAPVKDEVPFVASEINHFEMTQELISTISESVDVLLPDTMTFGEEELHPYVDDYDELERIQLEPEAIDDGLDDQLEIGAVPEDDLVVIHVQARSAYFNGADLLRVINYQQLKFGDMNIYHAYDENNKVVFSMSNMLQPGHFEPEHIADMRTPGIILFTQLSSLSMPEHVFDRMLHCAETFARELDGKLTTSDQQPLTDQKIQAFKEKALYFRSSPQSV